MSKCIDCGKNIDTKDTSSNYKGDFCLDCAVVRTAANKKKWNKKNSNSIFRVGRGKRVRIIDRCIKKHILAYGLSASIDRAIKRQVKKNLDRMASTTINRAVSVSRREARRTAYYVILSLGARSLLGSSGASKRSVKGMRSKMIKDIEELIPAKDRRPGA